MRRAWVVVLAVGLLSGCELFTGTGGPRSGDGTIRALGNANKPSVGVIEDNGEFIIIVDQEPIFHKKNAPQKHMTWELDNDAKSVWKFGSVAVDPEKTSGHIAMTNCAVSGNDHQFKCDNDGTKGVYKYKIKLVRRSDGFTIESPDPWIRNG